MKDKIMTYFYLTLACILFSIQFIFSKLYQKNSDETLIAGSWMSLFGAIWMFAMFFISNGFHFEISAISVFYAFTYAIVLLMCNIFAFFAMTMGKVSTVTMYMLLGGLILPFFYGIIFLNEELTLFKVIGILLMLLSFLPMLTDNNKVTDKKKSKKIVYVLLCFSVFIFNGLISIISKAHQIDKNAVGINDFLILTAIIGFAAAFIFIFILTIINKNKNNKGFLETAFSGVGSEFSFKWITIMFCISGAFTIMNGIGNVFSLTCAETMDSSIQFPVISGAVVPLTAIFSWIFFKEKIKKTDAIGIFIAIAGILMFIL